MKIKEFFKLTKWKIILFLILLGLSSIQRQRGIEAFVRGFPFEFFIDGCYMMSRGLFWMCGDNSFYFHAFIIDIIILYLVSCIIMYLYEKIRKK